MPKGIYQARLEEMGLTLELWEHNRAMGRIWCYMCRQFKDPNCFSPGIRKTKRNGRMCRSCNVLYHRRRYHFLKCQKASKRGEQ